jgi:hypothetical protein
MTTHDEVQRSHVTDNDFGELVKRQLCSCCRHMSVVRAVGVILEWASHGCLNKGNPRLCTALCIGVCHLLYAHHAWNTLTAERVDYVHHWVS